MMDTQSLPDRHVLCIDMKSFYASCSAVWLNLDPLTCYLAVVADTERSGSVVLAASPRLKKEFGVRTGSRLFEIPKDPRIKVVNAQMKTYLRVSSEITKLLLRYVPKEAIHTYSVDESFITLSGTDRLWGDVMQTAWEIQQQITEQFDLPCAIGIGPNMLLAKLCLDLEAKKTGVSRWSYEDVPHKLWPITPLSTMWGIGTRMERRLERIGVTTVGQLAQFPLQRLEKMFGIMGTQLYYHAHGLDFSELGAPIMAGQISFGKSQILLRDYESEKEIKHVILEMCEETARRARKHQRCGRTISLGIGYSRQYGGGFQRSQTMDAPSNATLAIYEACLMIFQKNYEGYPVRKISIALSNIEVDDQIQLNLFDDGLEKQRTLGYVVDGLRQRYGDDAVLRAVSYTEAGTAKHRSTLIGGHKA